MSIPRVYRVDILTRSNETLTVATGLSRLDAISVAGECERHGDTARVFNEQNGKELINGHDGQIREVD